jgi:thiamine biosynthesis lipoprotein
MPLQELLAVDACTSQWPLWGTTARLVVSSGEVGAARSIVERELAAVELACSRFRPDSEILAAAGRTSRVSPLLAELVAVALDAARRTDGTVDPTVGAVLSGLGYDRDLALVTAAGAGPAVFAAPNWRAVKLRDRELTVPHGVTLDLGATAKAFAADRCARLVAETGTGVLVALGGDIATRGTAPDGGPWRVLVQDGIDEPGCTVALPSGAALATSSTLSRQWGTLHHIVDPRTCRPAERVWRTVSVAAPTCVDANTMSTASVVLGARAVAWLRLRAATARLVPAAGEPIVTVGGWPS